MLELIKLKLKKPERYCPQILCEIGSSFINSYPSETKLTSEPHCIELGIYILKKILGQSTELSTETLDDIALLKRWDATPSHRHNFFKPLIAQSQDCLELLDKRFDSMLQSTDKQMNLFSLINNLFLKYLPNEEYEKTCEIIEKNDVEAAIETLNQLNETLFDQTLSDKQNAAIDVLEKNKYMILRYCNLLQLPFDGFLKNDNTLVIYKDNEKFIELLMENITFSLEHNDNIINSECDELQNDVHSIAVNVEDCQDSLLTGKSMQPSAACKELINTNRKEISNRLTALRKQIALLEQFETALSSTADHGNFNLSCQINTFKTKLKLHIERIEEQSSKLTKFDKLLLDTEQGNQCCKKSVHYEKLTQHYKEIKESYLLIKERADHYVKTLDKQIKEFRNEIYEWVQLFYKYEKDAKLLAPQSIFHTQRKTINRMILSGEKIVNKIEIFQEKFNNIKVLLQQYSDRSNNLVGICQTIQDENNENLLSRLFYTQCRSLFNRSSSQFRVFLSSQANFALDKLRADGENILDKLNKLKELKTTSEIVTPPRPLKPISQKRQGSDEFVQSPSRKTLRKEISEAAIVETDKENYSSPINNTRRGLFT